MSDLHAADIIADADLEDDVELACRLEATPGLLRITLAKIKLYLSSFLVPAGGITGDVLTKNTATDFDYDWAAPTGGGGGGGGSLPYSETFFNPPLAATFTDPYTAGGGAPTLTDDTDVGLVIDGGSPSGTNIRAKFKALPASGDWTVIFRLVAIVPTANFGGIGVFIARAAKDRGVFLNQDNRSDMRIEQWTGNSFNSAPLGDGLYGLYKPFVKCQYISATNKIQVYFSLDNKVWLASILLDCASTIGGVPAFIGPDVAYAGTPYRIVGCISYWWQSW